MGKYKKGANLASDIIDAFIEGAFEGDMKSLRNAINNSADEVIGDVSEQLKKAYKSAPENLSSHRENYQGGSYTKQRQEKLYEERRLRAEAARRRHEEQVEKQKSQTGKKQALMLSYPMKRIGNYSSVICKVVGIAGMAITGVSLLSSLPAFIMGTASLGGAIFTGILFAGFSFLSLKGLADGKLLSMADRFVSVIGKRSYISLDELSEATGSSKKQLIKKIRKMLQLGFFPQGHLDAMNTTLMLTDKVFSQYKETKENAERMASENEIKAQNEIKEAKDKYPTLSAEEAKELQLMVDEGNKYVDKLHELNARIPGEIITKKLNRLEELLREIFENIQRHPEQMGKLHELMDYYLPTMIKLVGAYEEYDRVSAPGEDIISAKTEIEMTLDTINDAFKKLLNNLFKDSVWDVTTDAKVLTSMLKQKGLAEDI